MNFYSLDRFYFCTNKKKSMIVEVSFCLKSEVNADILSRAVKKAMTLFPTWQSRPYVDADSGYITFRKNENPVPVCYDDHTYVKLGSDESNGYLFRVFYKGNRISIRAFHCLGDGYVASLFATHVLYFYLKELHPDLDGGDFIFSEIPNSADDDFVKKAAEYLADLPEKSSEESAEVINTDGRFVEDFEMEHYFTEKARSVHIICDNKSYMEYCSSHQVSSTSFLTDLIARSVYEAYGVKNKRMDACIAVDLRKQFNSKSFHNFATDITLCYDYEMLEMEEEKRYEILCSRLKKAIDTEKLAKQTVDYGASCEVLNQYYTLASHALVEERLTEQQKSNLVSFYISNLSKLPIPNEFDKYIDNVYIVGNPVKPETNYYITRFEDVLNIIVSQNFDNIKVVELLVEKLNCLGITSSIQTNELFTYDYASIENFEMIKQGECE